MKEDHLMMFTFKTILIPVDFTINTEVAVKKAIEIANRDEAHIHLMHLLHPLSHLSSGITALVERPDLETALKMLLQWKKSIEETVSSLHVYTHVISGTTLKEAIHQKSQAIGADLIVIGRNLSHNRLTFTSKIVTSEIAERSGIAVLTVKPGSLHKTIRNVVVPISEEIPRHKMEVLAALSRNNRICIHLVTFMNETHEHDQFSASSLLKVYQWLKNALHCPVEYVVLHGNNKAKALLAHAEKVHADILLVHPRSETRVGWRNRHISDLLAPSSQVQVLAVNPQVSSYH